MWNNILRRFTPKRPTVHAVYLQGVIAARAGPRGISFAAIEGVLEQAFKGGPHRPEAVALIINSPGGSPVQSNLIGQKIDDLHTKTKIPVLAFAEDVAASGGYWLLCAGNEIFADEASIVGSIGVVSGSFGLHDFIARHGVERRVYTAGERKVRLDPFLPPKEEDVARLKATLEEVHEIFKSHVQRRRGDKIKGKEEEVFSGDFFTGKKGVELGLVDKIGSLHAVAKERFGEDVRINYVNPRRFPFLPFGLGGGTSAGAHGALSGGSSWAAALTEEMLAAAESRVEERVLRERLGL